VTTPSTTFTWSPGVAVSQYDLRVGTTLNAGDIYESGHTTATSSPLVALPGGNKTIFVRLYSLIGSTWTATNYTFTGPPSTGFSVSGHISSSICCNQSVPGVSVNINTTPPMNAISDASGNFTFLNVPSGTYTVTPSFSAAGASSIFYPASQTIPVNNNIFGGLNFTATIGYTVSGTVNYPSGTKTGTIYVSLQNPNGNNGGMAPGTSISAPGAFVIRGVPPGTYTLQAWMDNLGKGVRNASNPITPTGSAPSVTVNGSLSDGGVSIADPTTSPDLSTVPQIQKISAFDNGAVIQFRGITDSSGIEQPTSYYVQWSTSSTFSPVTGHHSFPAFGTNDTNIWLLNGELPGFSGIYSGQLPLYFRVYGAAGSSHSNWSTISDAVTIAEPEGGNTVTGTVTYSGTASGPMYVGFFDQGTGNVFVAPYSNPVSGQTYSVQVPTGSNYFMFGIVDQNNDGVVDAGDIANTNTKGNPPAVVVSPSSTSHDLALSSATVATVTTNHSQVDGLYDNYSLNFDTRGLTKLPVAVSLTAGPNVLYPADIAGCMGCNNRFQFWTSLNGVRPGVGDAYTLHVTYANAPPEDVIATVTTVLDAFATGLTPTSEGSGITQPTFSWTDPLNASSYTYRFTLNNPTGGSLWQVPGNNSKLDGLPSTVTSLVWGVDPTDNTNAPSVPNLTPGTTYQWSVQVQDSDGNSAQQQVNYKP